MDKINNFLKKNNKGIKVGDKWIPQSTKRLICRDGFSVSVQANEFAYCCPRKNIAWPYVEVELGHPSEPDILISQYAENMDDLTHTNYPFVPIKVVNKLIDKHQGIRNF